MTQSRSSLYIIYYYPFIYSNTFTTEQQCTLHILSLEYGLSLHVLRAQLLSLEGVWVGLNLKFSLVTESKVMREIFVLELLVVGQHLSSSLLWSHLENSPPLCSSLRAFQRGVASSEKAGQPHQSDTSPCLWLQDSL